LRRKQTRRKLDSMMVVVQKNSWEVEKNLEAVGKLESGVA
jgi:hypothetical protein